MQRDRHTVNLLVPLAEWFREEAARRGRSVSSLLEKAAEEFHERTVERHANWLAAPKTGKKPKGAKP